MTADSLIVFLKRILETGTIQKSTASLQQLLYILTAQKADPEMIKLVNQTLCNISDAKEDARKPSFSEDSLRIAIRRAEERKRREAEFEIRGRC